jgi:predicted amidohydrolase YtcJ
MECTPNLIFHHGKIYTSDTLCTIAEAVAVKDDKIIAVGSNDSVMTMADSKTETIDLAGRLMIPGLNDSHAHPFMEANQVTAVSFSEARNISDLLDALKTRAKTTKPGEWLLGSMSWHETQLSEGRLPTREELDRACPDNPVSIPRGAHVKVANSRALQIAGIGADTEIPGGVIDRDSSGQPTGILMDAAADRLTAAEPKADASKFGEAMIAVAKKLNGYGVTTSAESGAIGASAETSEYNLKTVMTLCKEKKLPLRLSASFFSTSYEMAKYGVTAFSETQNTDFFKFQGIKVMSDGGVESANLIDPYEVISGVQPDPDYHGIEVWPPSRQNELRRIMDLCAGAHLQLQIHIHGDKSAASIIPLLSEQGNKTDIGKLNWTICHLPLSTDEQLETIKRLGICVTVQHQPYLLGENYLRYWGNSRANAMARYRKMVDMGIRMGGGTDMPIDPLNPFCSIEWMVDRKTITGKVLGKEHSITLDEAVRLWTRGSADCEGWGSMIGSIKVDKKADFAVLSQDIFQVPVGEIHNTVAEQTWIDGKCVYRRG